MKKLLEWARWTSVAVMIVYCIVLAKKWDRAIEDTDRRSKAVATQLESVRAACVQGKPVCGRPKTLQRLHGLAMHANPGTTKVWIHMKPWPPKFCRAVDGKCYGFQMHGDTGHQIVALIGAFLEELDVMPADRRDIREALYRLVRKDP